MPCPAPSPALAAAWPPESYWCSTIVPRWRFASCLVAGCCPDGGLQAPGRSPLWATCCLLHLTCSLARLGTTSELRVRASYSEDPWSRTMPHLSHAGRLDASRAHVSFLTSRQSFSPVQPGMQAFQFWAPLLEHCGIRKVSLVVCPLWPCPRRWNPAPCSYTSVCGPFRATLML